MKVGLVLSCVNCDPGVIQTAAIDAICSTTAPSGTRVHWCTGSRTVCVCYDGMTSVVDGGGQCGHLTMRNWTNTAHNTRIMHMHKRIAAKPIIAYLKKSALLPRLQSAYKTGHTSELSDILLGCWWSVYAGAIRFICSFWHGGPPHSSASPEALLWHNWFGASMVRVLYGRPPSVRTNWFVYFVSSADSVWRTTGVGS